MDSALPICSFSSYFGLKLETRNPALGQKLFCCIFIWLLQCFQRKWHPVLSKNLSQTSSSRLREMRNKMLREIQSVISVSVHSIQVSLSAWTPLENVYSITIRSSTRAKGFPQLGKKGGFVFFGVFSRFFFFFFLDKWLTPFDLWKN